MSITETKKYVTYEEFGAVGNGIVDDFPAIYAAHVYANEHGLTVKASDSAVYYIRSTRVNVDGESAIRSVPIRTDVEWGEANFIIDDTNVTAPGYNFPMCYTHVFKVVSDYPEIKLEDRAVLDRIIEGGLDPASTRVNIDLGYPAMIIPYDSSYKVYRRRGYGMLSYGKEMHEVIVLDKDGNIDPDTPVLFDYKRLDYVLVIRLDIKPITISGGIFTTRACRDNNVILKDGEYTCRDPYISRGISVNRSYTTVRGVRHYVTGEVTVAEQIADGKITRVSPCYSGFLTSIKANEVTFLDCVLTGRRCYTRPSYSKLRGTGGTYDFRANSTNKIVLKNVVQSNFWIRIDENDNITPAKEGDEGAVTSLHYLERGGQTIKLHWGIGESDFCKNVEYHGCTMSRFDAHEGLYNGKITDSTMNYISLTGKGTVTVENTRWFAEGKGDGSNSLFHLREDYGSTWEGALIAKNVKAYVHTEGKPSLVFNWYNNWFYGYKTYTPSLDIDGLTFYDIKTREALPRGYEIRSFTFDRANEPAIHLPETKNRKPYHEYIDTDGDGLVDILGIEYREEDKPKYANGILGESNINLNPTSPPEFISVKGNSQGISYTVQDTSDYMDIPDGGFFGRTEFITDSGSAVGTATEMEETFKFIKIGAEA